MKITSLTRLAVVVTGVALIAGQSGAEAARPADATRSGLLQTAISADEAGARTAMPAYIRVAANRSTRFRRTITPRRTTATIRRNRQPAALKSRQRRQKANGPHSGWINVIPVSPPIYHAPSSPTPTAPPPPPPAPPQHDDDCMSCD